MIWIVYISDIYIVNEGVFKGYVFDFIVEEINRGDFDFVIYIGDIIN